MSVKNHVGVWKGSYGCLERIMFVSAKGYMGSAKGHVGVFKGFIGL